jgi:predicted RNase H-like nuclease (RuvC/YqgF family)
MEDKNPKIDDTLMHLRPKTAEEKLMWAEMSVDKLKLENSQLKQEIGILQSDLEELKHEMKSNQHGALLLKHKNLKNQILDKDNRIKDLKKTNDQLMDKVIRLQVK